MHIKKFFQGDNVRYIGNNSKIVDAVGHKIGEVICSVQNEHRGYVVEFERFSYIVDENSLQKVSVKETERQQQALMKKIRKYDEPENV